MSREKRKLSPIPRQFVRKKQSAMAACFYRALQAGRKNGRQSDAFLRKAIAFFFSLLYNSFTAKKEKKQT